MPNPIRDTTDLHQLVADHEVRLGRTERLTQDSFAIYGPRSDLADQWGIRVRIGLLSDGTYGVERYSETGARTIPTWV